MNKKTLLQGFGAVLVLMGLLGFVMNPVLGIFQVNFLLNIVHLLTGGLALYVAMKMPANMSMFGKVFGIVYALITVLGFLLPSGNGDILGLVTVNMADNFLHVAITAFLLYVGFTNETVAAKV